MKSQVEDIISKKHYRSKRTKDKIMKLLQINIRTSATLKDKQFIIIILIFKRWIKKNLQTAEGNTEIHKTWT